MARRILNRKDLRADFEAAERVKQDDDEEVEEEEAAEDEDEEEADEEAEEEAPEVEEAAEEEEEEEKPKKRKKKEPKEPKPKAKPRSRAAKVVRMKVLWGVFNNSNQRVAVYDYPKRKDFLIIDLGPAVVAVTHR